MDRVFGWALGTFSAVLALGIICLMLLWSPLVGPWAQERRGIANLREAQQDRQILIEEAQAKHEVSILQASAEKKAAKLRADAIEIIGAAAQRYPEYRQQEFIGAFAKALEDGKINQIIYVPTEAYIPVLEAGKR
jgi:regulator of protease activity HflC (stomatin/prohibitin superfamily)